MSHALKSSKRMSTTASRTRTATSSIAGAGTSSSMGPGPFLTMRLSSRDKPIIRNVMAGRRPFTSKRRVPVPAPRSFPAAISRRKIRVTSWSPMSSASRASCSTSSKTRAPVSKGSRRSRLSSRPIRTSVPPIFASVRTAPSIFWTGTIPSLATCNTTCAIPIGTTSMAEFIG